MTNPVSTVSEQLFSSARNRIPGGVNSPVRAFGAVGGTPRFIKRAEGAYLFDEDGRRYIDYVLSWGPMIAGHAHPAVLAAVREKLGDGLSFGAPTRIETEMAETLCALIPNLDMVRMVSSGTEATMSAIRLARGYTGRDMIIKFDGCYHGHSDSLLVKAGSGALTFGSPSSPGVPADLTQHTLVLPYNDSDAVAEAFRIHAGKIAAVIVEPVAGNMNCVPPLPDFHQTLRRECTDGGALLIFDEVMTGFRLGPGGAQTRFGVDADLITLGKVIGGGMPVGAFGGRREVMAQLAPAGPVYQAGTLSGNPVAMAAGLATIKLTQTEGFYESLFAKTDALVSGVVAAAKNSGVPLLAQSAGSMFGFFFTDASAIHNLAEVQACDTARFNNFFHGMLDAGINLAPASYEAGFLSTAHSDADIAATIAAAQTLFEDMQS